MTIDFRPVPEALARKLPRQRRQASRSLRKLEVALKVRNAVKRPATQFPTARDMTTIRFLVSNSKNLELKTYYDVARLYPEHRKIHIEFSRDEVGKDIPAKRWLVVTI